MKVTHEDFEILAAAMDEKVLPEVNESIWEYSVKHCMKDPVVYYVSGILISALVRRTCNDHENAVSERFNQRFFPFGGQTYNDNHLETAMKKYCRLRHIDYWKQEG